jgi:hypothetical protein
MANHLFRVTILDSTSTTGAGKTGLTSASSGLIISTIADNEAAPTVYTAAGSTIETVGTLGTYAAPTATKCRFKEVDATNHPGLYEIQLADARVKVVGAASVVVTVTVTGGAQVDRLLLLGDSTGTYDLTPEKQIEVIMGNSVNVRTNTNGDMVVYGSDGVTGIWTYTFAAGNITASAP